MNTLAERFAAERLRHKDTQEFLAELAGVSKQAISKIESGATLEPASSTLDPIAEHWRVRTKWLSHGTKPRERSEELAWSDVVGFSQAAGLGTGAEANEYAETHKLRFKAASLARKGLDHTKLAVFYGKGDSMLPRIQSGDAILFDTSDTRPTDGTVYIVMWKGEYYAKRAEILDGTVYFRTDNPSGDHNWNKPKRMDAKRDPIEIIGRVRWIGSWED